MERNGICADIHISTISSVFYWASFKMYLPRIYDALTHAHTCSESLEFHLDTGKGEHKEETEEEREKIHYCCRFYFTLY